MNDFMSKSEKKGLKISSVAVHWYGPPEPNIFINYIRNVNKKYKKDIYITEFAIFDFSGNYQYTPKQALGFLKKVLPELECMEFVKGYAWFDAYNKKKWWEKKYSHIKLFNKDRSLSELGQFYSNFNGQKVQCD